MLWVTQPGISVALYSRNRILQAAHSDGSADLAMSLRTRPCRAPQHVPSSACLVAQEGYLPQNMFPMELWGLGRSELSGVRL